MECKHRLVCGSCGVHTYDAASEEDEDKGFHDMRLCACYFVGDEHQCEDYTPNNGHEESNWLPPFTNQEIIEGLRNALRYYAYPDLYCSEEIKKRDICKDDCSGFYKKSGEVARQALNHWTKNTKRVKNASV
jgi:hypothetical protein